MPACAAPAFNCHKVSVRFGRASSCPLRPWQGLRHRAKAVRGRAGVNRSFRLSCGRAAVTGASTASCAGVFTPCDTFGANATTAAIAASMMRMSRIITYLVNPNGNHI